MVKSGAIRLAAQEKDASGTTTDLSHEAVVEISTALRQLLADVFALYVKL
jgi:DNA-binding ferritin-like protein